MGGAGIVMLSKPLLTVCGASGGKIDFELLIGRIILNGFLVSHDCFVPTSLLAESNRAVICVDCHLDILLCVFYLLRLGFLLSLESSQLLQFGFLCSICFLLLLELFFFAVVETALKS